MTDLAAWLTAQLDADERIARAATAGPWSVDDVSCAEAIYGPDGWTTVVAGGRWGGEASVFESTEDAIHIAEHDPARVLREVEAKRGLLAEHTPRDGRCRVCAAHANGQWTRFRAPCTTLRLLALPYADRPGYQEGWAP